MPGERLGRYAVLGELGSGGMGRVYRAHDPVLGREVAIKILRDDLAGSRGDLLAEARAASALNHAGICAIYDIGEVEGRPFIAMELVDGRPLGTQIPSGGLPLETALRLGCQIAGALAHAHERGVVHRDLKSQNVLVTPAWDAKLLDFGLARRLEPASLDSITRPAPADTIDDAIVGTLPYMAPETLRGAPVSRAADVWAFGVLLHEMLVGFRPFSGSTSFDLAAAILNQPPRPLPASVPAAVAAVVARCLDKEAPRRYSSAREPLAALEALQSAPSAGVQAPPAALAPPRLGTRRRVLLGALALVVVFGVLAWRLPSMTGLRPASAPAAVSSLIVLPFDSLSQDPNDAYLAEGMTDALINDLSRVPALGGKVISRASSIRYKSLGKSTREIAAELGVGAIVDGTVLRSADQVRISVRLVDAAADRNLWAREYTRDLTNVLQLQGEVARAIVTEIRASFAPDDEARLTNSPTVDPRVHEAFLKGRHFWNRRTMEALTQAIAYFQQAIDLQQDYAPAHAGLAQSLVVLPAFPLSAMAPAEAFPRARRAAERAIALDPRLSEAHAGLGYVLLYTEGLAAAQPSFLRALSINPNDPTARFWYGAALASGGRLNESLEQFQRAAALDPVSPIIISGLSWGTYMQRRFAESLDHARSALALDPNFLIARYRLGQALLHQQRYDEAIVELETARRQWDSNPDLMAAAGYAYARAGRRQEALAALKSLERLAVSAPYVSPYTMALVHAGLGNQADAFTWLGRAVDEGGWGAAFLGIEPDLDPLRPDPRFAALLERRKR